MRKRAVISAHLISKPETVGADIISHRNSASKSLRKSQSQSLSISQSQPLSISESQSLSISQFQPLSISKSQSLSISLSQSLSISQSQSLGISQSQSPSILQSLSLRREVINIVDSLNEGSSSRKPIAESISPTLTKDLKNSQPIAINPMSLTFR